jgi:Gly-Xaa carboxypeptidase
VIPLLPYEYLCIHTAMSREKEGGIALPITNTHAPPAPKSLPWGKRIVAGVGLSAILYLLFSAFDGPVPWSTDALTDGETFASTGCHQAEPLLPHFDTSAAVSGKEGRIRDWLSGAVKIPTEMFDVMGPIGEDKRWDIFYNFSDCKYTLP